MADVKLESLEKIEQLRARIEEMLERFAELLERCEQLDKTNSILRERLEAVQNRNLALSREIDALRAASGGNGEDNGQEILDRIDRMLEKFGELQI